MSYDSKFLGLANELPPIPSPPTGLNFVPFRRSGNIVYLAGQGPAWGNQFKYVGKLGREVSVEKGAAAARLTALNLLQTLRQAIRTLDSVRQIIEVSGMVNSAPGFIDQPKVINGCSDCLVEIFGHAGQHARSAVGMAELPFNLSVEITMIVEVV
jgi:enamine deaminase RidA (YjgF/YER057c/UK114 family)